MASTTALQVGDPVPHFIARTRGGGVADYATIWQRRNLLLVAVPPPTAQQYVDELLRQTPAFDQHQTTVVFTEDVISGLPVPGLLVADRWGEIIHLVAPASANDLPTAATLLEWVEAIEQRCPECEGEAR